MVFFCFPLVLKLFIQTAYLFLVGRTLVAIINCAVIIFYGVCLINFSISVAIIPGTRNKILKSFLWPTIICLFNPYWFFISCYLKIERKTIFSLLCYINNWFRFKFLLISYKFFWLLIDSFLFLCFFCN